MRIFRLPSLQRRNDNWIAGAFDHEGFDYNEIPGDIIKHLGNTVVNETYYNCSQVQRVCELVNSGIVTDNDIFYIDDLNVEIHNQVYDATNGLRCSIYGFLEDTYQLAVNSRTITKFNGVFVASQSARESLYKSPLYRSGNVYVTGYPSNVWSLRSEAYKSKSYKGKVKKQIIYPYGSRGANMFLQLTDVIHEIDPDISFVVYSDEYMFSGVRKEMFDNLSKKIKIKVLENVPNEELLVAFAESSLCLSTHGFLFDNFALLSLSLDVPVMLPHNESNMELLSEYDNKHDYVYSDVNWKQKIFARTLPSDEENLKNELIPLCERIVKLVNNKVDENLHKKVLHYNNFIANTCSIIKRKESEKWSRT